MGRLAHRKAIMSNNENIEHTVQIGSRPTGKGFQKILVFLLTGLAYMLIFAREDEAHRAGRQRDQDGWFPDHPSRHPGQSKPIQVNSSDQGRQEQHQPGKKRQAIRHEL